MIIDMRGVVCMPSGSISFAKVTLLFKTCKKQMEKFGYVAKKLYFCIAIQNNRTVFQFAN
jgi:hypothetical protein